MIKKLMGLGREKKVLLKNTFMLYILRFSTYFFGFITVPYQTRVLGPTLYGKVGAAMALMLYFQLLIDFGFMLSATQEVAYHAKDEKKVSIIFSSVQYAKMAFIALSFVLLAIICLVMPIYREDYLFYFIYLIGTALTGLVPDFVYRGLQQMGPVTFRVVISRVVFTVLIFVTLKSPEDYMVIPILSAVGNFIALLWSLIYLYRNFGIHLVKVTREELMRNVKTSSTFFLSRVAGTLYTNFNVLILGQVAPLSRGNYAVADKLIVTGQSALTPISDSVYPYMTKNKDFKMIKRILVVMMPVIFLACLIAFIFAEPLSVFIFGKEYAGAGRILRGMLPAAVFTLPDYLLGFPTMTALGMTKYANYSIYLSSALHLINVTVLYFLGYLNAVSLAWLMSVAMGIELLYRAYHVRRVWNLRKNGN